MFNRIDRKQFIIIAAAVMALIVLIAVLAPVLFPELLSPREIEAPALRVHFIDVGQGDSILLESKGDYVLIDAGEREYGGVVTSYLQSHGADELKYVIATHPHSDHVGGLADVIRSVRTDSFITSESDQNTSTWRKVLSAVDETGADYIDAKVGATYSFGEAAFTILAPNSDSYEGYNNYSVVTKVTCGDVSFMLTGDAEKLSEQEMLDAGYDLSADVLKCGHHGSSTSSTAKFLKAVDPSYAVISCGKGNDYGHPHKETLKKLSLMGCSVYRTDELGTIIAETDGVTVSFSAERGEIPTAKADISSEDIGYYIGNKNSHVFHLPNCSGVINMSEKNKVRFSDREEALEQGYTPCSMCEP